MEKINFARALVAGIVGTVVMSLLVVAGPMMGLRMAGPWELLASFMKLPVAVGWIAHFMIGVVLAIIYAAVAASRLPGSPWLRGALFAIAPWLVAQVMLMPMMGAGLFGGSALVALGSLMGHLVYGGSLGATYRPATAI